MPASWSRRARRLRSSAIRAIPTRSACCAVCRGRGGARITAGSTPFPAFRRARTRSIQGCVFAPRCGLAEEKCLQRRAAALSIWADARAAAIFTRARRRCRASTPDDLPAPVAVDRSRPPLLEAIGLSKTFGGAPPSSACPARGLARAVAGRDAGPGRRVGERQDHAGATPARPRRRRIPAESSNWTVTALGGESRTRRADSCKSLQIVFQNPDSALNRSHTRAPPDRTRHREARRRSQARAPGAAQGIDPIGAPHRAISGRAAARSSRAD